MLIKDNNKIYSVANGRTYPIEEVKDVVFSSKMMGDGIALEINDSKILSPISGTVIALFPDGHAIGLRSSNGIEVLIHIGLNISNLDGKGFYPQIEISQKVKIGDILVKLNLNELKGIDLTTILVFTNSKIVEKTEMGIVIGGQSLIAEVKL